MSILIKIVELDLKKFGFKVNICQKCSKFRFIRSKVRFFMSKLIKIVELGKKNSKKFGFMVNICRKTDFLTSKLP